MSNWKIEFVNTIINGSNECLILLFRYGSERETSDTDYLAVFDGYISPVNFSLGGIDFWGVNTDSFFSDQRQLEFPPDDN